MKKILIVLAIIIGLSALIGLAIAGKYNSLVKQEEAVKTAWAQVENVYQRRLDLIPNLVETVKGYAKHEKDVFIDVTTARAGVGQMKIDAGLINDPAALQSFQKVQASLSGALSRLLAVAENYPALKANENFLALQSQLEGTENRIAVERKRYNDIAQGYNTSIRQFPANFIAGMFGFKGKAYFESEPAAAKAPAVKF
ncbi:MAG: LemA family protein [bacterium]|nr:LemA family protein [bacterium]MDD5354153.1 LemA family protein [bacterium]MDD5755830.1 LemA family protein [bacterium]